MAALAATGLTCCGGGGGGEGGNYAYRTFTFDSPNLIGAMVVHVGEPQDGSANRYEANITFTTKNGGSSIFPGYFRVTQAESDVTSDKTGVTMTTTEMIEVGITGNIGTAAEGDDGLIMFFSDFVKQVNEDDEVDEDVTADNPPKPLIRMAYDTPREGNYFMTFYLKTEDENGNGGGNTYEATNIGPYGFTVTY